MNFDEFLRDIIDIEEVERSEGKDKLNFRHFLCDHNVCDGVYSGIYIVIHHRDFLPKWLDDYNAVLRIYDHAIPLFETQIKTKGREVSISDFIGSEFTVCYDFIHEATVKVGFNKDFKDIFYESVLYSMNVIKPNHTIPITKQPTQLIRSESLRKLRAIKQSAETMSKLQAL